MVIQSLESVSTALDVCLNDVGKVQGGHSPVMIKIPDFSRH